MSYRIQGKRSYWLSWNRTTDWRPAGYSGGSASPHLLVLLLLPRLFALLSYCILAFSGPSWVDIKCCCCLITKSNLTFCDPMNCSTTGFPVLHYIPEFAQTHVHWVADAIQSSHSLTPSSHLALSLSQHQGLFQCVCSSHQVTKVLELSISPSDKYSGLITFRIDWFDLLAV